MKVRHEAPAKGTHVGMSTLRRDDERFLRGQGSYVADVHLPGMVYAAVLRSPHASARLQRLDIGKALQVSGVHRIITFKDLPSDIRIPVRLGPRPERMAPALQPLLAGDVVRYVGEPIAVVVARDRYVAEDALDHIEVEFAELPVVATVARALEAGAPLVHAGVDGNILERLEVRTGIGRAALAGCPHRLRERFNVQRHTAVPLETRGFAAALDARTGVLMLYGATKFPHFVRLALAEMFGYPERLIHFRASDVGGGFGVRGELYPEEILVSWLALQMRRPVQWIEDRREHFMATNHSRHQEHDLEVGFTAEGKIVALVDRYTYDLGAYLRTNGMVVPMLTRALLPGPYKIANYECEGLIVLTNKTPVGSYRGPGRFEANFVRERVVDLIAGRLGLDPADVRRRNFLQPDDMPYNVGTGSFNEETIFDDGDFPTVFETALDMVGYAQIRKDQAELRRQGRYVGVGIGCLIEKTGLGPWESARVEIDGSGSVVVYSGAVTLGESLDTILAQVAADELNTSPDKVSVFMADSMLVPRGHGTGGSRGASVATGAVVEAARRVRGKVLAVAATKLEADPTDLVIEDGEVHVRGLRARAISFRDLARATLTIEPGRVFDGDRVLSATAFFAQGRRDGDVVHPRMDYAFGTHVAMVEVDPELGTVKLLRHVIAYDIGRAINPMVVEGQFCGGLAQGIGGALYEELVYDGEGQIGTTTFMDYLLPGASEMPVDLQCRILELTPSTANPLGVKGGAEAGISGAGAAVGNAVADALAPFGAHVTRLPLKPDRVLALCLQGSARAGTSPVAAG